jgi:hypothetical protein
MFRPAHTATIAAMTLAAPAAAQSHDEIMQAWLASPHADATSEAFTHWNEEGAVEVECATCHSGEGYLDWVGADGSAPGVVDAPAPIESVIGCEVCHAEATEALETVTFPSGEELGTDLGSSLVCAVCHQGRQSTDSVDEAVAELDADTTSEELAFLNIHYAASAATLYGSEARGGYQYEGQDYAGRFEHVGSFDTCNECHNPHTLEVAFEPCASCHEDADEFAAIRATEADVDGDGDTTEGIASAIDTLHGRLLTAIQTYAEEVAGTPIVYESHSYPYYFVDTDGDGTASEEEAAYPNRYQSWTPRLLRAAYNYQYAAKDPGGYAHNAHYVIQLLYDSLTDLSTQVEVETAGLVRP